MTLPTWTLRRLIMESDVTLGKLCKPDGTVFCCTLEEPWKNNQQDISCIPAGTYKVVEHNGKAWQKVFRLENVPNRAGVLIHWGNTTDDIEGCILVGKSFGKLKGRKSKKILTAVLNSKSAFSELRMAIKGDFYLRIVDRVNKEEK